jgi:iron complex transport system ATP-binding protein
MIPAVDVRHLRLYYKKEKVLDNLSFRVATGEFFLIIGPNGAGKTSLLRVLGGTLPLSSGRVTILGSDLSSYSRKRLSQKVAVVPQYEPLDFPFTVEETVLMGRAPHLPFLALEREPDRQIARQAMEFTQTLHLACRRLDQLSGGERQRVIIARAICQQPEVILLDEPTAALDPAHQLRIMDLMERFRREYSTTVIMVSHDLNLAAMYGDRLLLLKEGAVQRQGRPAEVLTEEELFRGYGCRMTVERDYRGRSVRVSLIPEKFLS